MLSPALKDKTVEKATSPRATGNAGDIFEQHVGAMFLVLLLTRGIPAVFRDCQVKEVSFQTQHLDWKTDDLLVTCSTNTNVKRQLAIQVKLEFAIRNSSDDFVKTFQGFWKDFKMAEKFDSDKDVLVLATQRSNVSLDGLNSLLECARNSSNAEDFTHRLAIPGYLSKKTKDCKLIIKDVIEEMDSLDIREEEFWRFLKTVHILFLDLTSSTAQQEAVCKNQLALSKGGSDAMHVAENTWNSLLTISAASKSNARTLSRSDLPNVIRTQYNAVQDPMASLQVLTEHSCTTLDTITSTIAGTVNLPRTETIAKTVESLIKNHVVVLTGPPGSGKSVLAKAIVQQHMHDCFCLSFRAEEFAESHIDGVLQGPITGQQLATLMGAQEKVLIHVESLERLLEHSTRDAFTDLVRIAKRYPNILLLLTCRDYSVNVALTAFFEQNQLVYEIVKVPPLREEEIVEITNKFPKLASPMSHQELRRLLHVPYLLDMAARMDWSDRQNMPLNVMAFREKCWSVMIRKDSLTVAGLPDRRERALVDLAVRRARELRPFVPTDTIDVEALDLLHKDGIILKEREGFAAPAHDIIEDWAIMHWIESLVIKHEWQAIPIVNDVGGHPAIRRGFREWLKERMGGDDRKAVQFILSTYKDDSLPKHFRDDVLVSMLLSYSVGDFILHQKDQILADDARLLVRLIHLMRVACKKIRKQSDVMNMHISVLLEPEGRAWPVLLKIVADELDNLLPNHIGQILGLFEDWSYGASANSLTLEVVSFSKVAYTLLSQLEDYHNDGLRRRVLETIARIPCAYEEIFVDLIGRASSKSEQYDSMAKEFGEILIYESDGIQACRYFPEQTAKLILFRCRMSEQVFKNASEFDASLGTEPEFGLRSSLRSHFFPSSAIQGPFFPLLTYHPQIGLRLVLDLVNHAGDFYGNRKWPAASLKPAYRITISINDCEGVKQWANNYLWQAYRGTGAIPNVIQCALMALERWLLEMCEDSIPVESWLLEILKESNNVMATSVVASVCNAYPYHCSTAAFSFLKSKECVELDRLRMVKEREFMQATLLSFSKKDKSYVYERKKSNALVHRQHDIEILTLKLQAIGQVEQVQKIIDSHLAKIPQEDQRIEEDRYWLLALHRMDFRRLKIHNMSSSSESIGSEDKSGKSTAKPLVIGEMDADLQNFISSGAKEKQQYVAARSLLEWGLKRWRQNLESDDDNFWQNFLALAQNTPQGKDTLGDRKILEIGQGIVAAICVRDHLEGMTNDDRQWCIDTLIAEIERNSDSEDYAIHVSHNPMSPDRHAAYVFPKILPFDADNTKILKAVSRAIVHPSSQVSIWAAEGISEYLGSKHQNMMLRCIGTVAMYANLLTRSEQRQTQRGIQRFLGKKQENVQNILRQVREAFVKGSVNAEHELAELDLTSWYGLYAAGRILSMLSKSPDFVLAKDFLTKIEQTIVDTWTAKDEESNASTDFEVVQSLVDKLADIALTMTPDTALLCCKPFLDAVGEYPDEVYVFIEALIIQEYKRFPNNTCFWVVWQAFADRIIDAPWSCKIRSSRSMGVKLIDRMLFSTYWRDGLQNRHLFVDHQRQISALTVKLPATSPVLLSFVHYLYTIGERLSPDVFIVVADILQDGDSTKLLSDKNAILYLESILQRHVYGKSTILKTDPNLRKATITILDQLVDVGSSAAYNMRDDFVTPSAGLPYSQT